MARALDKRDLPTKVCPVCRRPFTWRKKWDKVWTDVRYCSERCRRKRASIHTLDDRPTGQPKNVA